MARSFRNLFYLSSCSMSLRRFRRIHSIVLRGIKSDFACTKVSGVVSQYILRSGRLWHPLTSSMLKNKQIFSLIIFKTSFCFLSMTLVYPPIILFNTLLNNNSRSLRGFTISSSLPNFGIFPHSTTLIDDFG